MKTLVLRLILICLLLAISASLVGVGSAFARPNNVFEVTPGTIGTGGGKSSGGVFQVSGSAGSPGVASMSGGPFSVSSYGVGTVSPTAVILGLFQASAPQGFGDARLLLPVLLTVPLILLIRRFLGLLLKTCR